MSPHYGSAADEPELFLAFNDDLIRHVSHAVRASREDIEDACAFAWVEFLRVQPDREREWRGWLFRTAQRQAWKLNARHADTRAIVNIDESRSGRRSSRRTHVTGRSWLWSSRLRWRSCGKLPPFACRPWCSSAPNPQ